jgi:hypothetical protein
MADLNGFRINWGKFQLNIKYSDKIKYKNTKFSFVTTKIIA